MFATNYQLELYPIQALHRQLRFFGAKLEGKGGEAANPHVSIDPIIATSFTLQAMQHLISSENDPVDSQVCFS